jgi:signal transduction histidine kinase
VRETKGDVRRLSPAIDAFLRKARSRADDQDEAEDELQEILARLQIRFNDSGSVIVEVSDTGPGIPEDIRERIFDPFFTTKEVGRGTGQGLAIARSIVDKHGGSLTHQPAPGRGTKFVVRLPT